MFKFLQQFFSSLKTFFNKLSLFLPATLISDPKLHPVNQNHTHKRFLKFHERVKTETKKKRTRKIAELWIQIHCHATADRDKWIKMDFSSREKAYFCHCWFSPCCRNYETKPRELRVNCDGNKSMKRDWKCDNGIMKSKQKSWDSSMDKL